MKLKFIAILVGGLVFSTVLSAAELNQKSSQATAKKPSQEGQQRQLKEMKNIHHQNNIFQ